LEHAKSDIYDIMKSAIAKYYHPTTKENEYLIQQFAVYIISHKLTFRKATECRFIIDNKSYT